MKSVKRLTVEVKKLNQKLDSIGSQNRFMIYSASPWKFGWYNFIAGIFYSLGMLFGTAIVATVLVYLLGKMDFTRPLSVWVEKTLSQIKWEKIISVPTNTLNQKVIEQNQLIITPTN